MAPQLYLTVAEAAAKDAGRGIARIDPRDMDALEVEIGDVIQLAGKRTTGVKVMPCYPEYRSKQIIQIDGVVRANAGVALGERVECRKIIRRRALQVKLVPASATVSARDESLVGRLLEGLPVTAGDKVRAIQFSSKWQEYVVEQTVPEGTVVIDSATQLALAGKPRAEGSAWTGSACVSYEDIGGLSKEIQKIREIVELPLRCPQVFERLGITPPKGVLIYGPPGCGKTLIARAVANETDAHFIHINGPEIIHKFYGESEANLRSKFEEAERHAPSIIFLDEIDAIAPKRAEVTGEVEKRVVAQLLGLMDGLDRRGQVVVIAATNIPDSLDPALRRPGRFDREITIGIPDRKGRQEILEIHTRGMPLSGDVVLEELASITYGFVGADLQALCAEAAMRALRRFLPGRNPDELGFEELTELNVTMADFLDAYREIEPSAIREVQIEIPDVRWKDVGGLESVKERLVEMVQRPFDHPELYRQMGLDVPKGVLLTGPPGTGKTLVAKALANECRCNFICVRGPELMSKWVGETERKVREIFRTARQAAPCIVFFDELDSMCSNRSGGTGDSSVSNRVVGQLLTEMNGLQELRGVVLLGATNRPDLLDPALLRSGRFDLILEFPMPDFPARKQILKIHLQGRRLEPGVDLEMLARDTEGLSGADLELICRQAGLRAVNRYISSGLMSQDVVHGELPVILKSDLYDALSLIRH